MSPNGTAAHSRMDAALWPGKDSGGRRSAKDTRGNMISRSGRSAGAWRADARPSAGWRWAAGNALALVCLGMSSAASAADQGALGASSQATIRIEVSVAPRLSYGSLSFSPHTAGRPAQIKLRCAFLNTPTARFSLVPAGPAMVNASPPPAAPRLSGGSTCPRGGDLGWLVATRGERAEALVYLLTPL